MLAKIFGKGAAWGPFFLRLALGAIFIVRGAQHLFGAFGGAGLKPLSHTLLEMGLKPPLLWAAVVAGVEFLGGIFLIFGIITRWCALLLTLITAGAILTLHLSRGFVALQLPLLTLAAGISLLLSGAGRWALKD